MTRWWVLSWADQWTNTICHPVSGLSSISDWSDSLMLVSLFVRRGSYLCVLSPGISVSGVKASQHNTRAFRRRQATLGTFGAKRLHRIYSYFAPERNWTGAGQSGLARTMATSVLGSNWVAERKYLGWKLANNLGLVLGLSWYILYYVLLTDWLTAPQSTDLGIIPA